MRKLNTDSTLLVRSCFNKLFSVGLLLFLMMTPVLWAVELGVGGLDLGITLTGAWDNNVNYASTNPEEATEARFLPGITYTLPFQNHQFSVGYQGTYVTSNQENARSIRHSPIADLSLDFPGGLRMDMTDIFSKVQDYRKEETEELTGPDYAVNQAGVTAGYSAPGAINFNANYQNTIYRYEPRGRDRNSDGNEVGGRVMVPLHAKIGALVSGRWAEERVFEHPERNLLEYDYSGGVHVAGPSRIDLEFTVGYQFLDYVDDPDYEAEKSVLAKANISATISSAVSANAEVGTDPRSGVSYSGAMNLKPRENTSVRIGFSREVRRTFYLDSKYYIDNSVSITIRQKLFERFTVLGESQYSLSKYEKTETASNATAREDTRWKWRTGVQYAVGTWIEFGIQGERQSRDSNVSVAYAEYERTVVGFSVTFRTPR